MAKVYTSDYRSCYDTLEAEGLWNYEISERLTQQFETDNAAHLEGSTREDVGAVVLYYRDGEEIAYYDYENYVGSVYALGGTTACYMPE